ncbi:hypothetical protein HMPREF0880_02458 [Yokenella regensburgei ATCC 43003]|nr:hypothetical protein HMPREF0880_02458 [Yokenella regensburgei ATCC 43003]
MTLMISCQQHTLLAACHNQCLDIALILRLTNEISDLVYHQ